MIKALMGAAGAGGDPLYINDYFNMFGYEGNETNRSIVTNIDMTDGKSLAWIKSRQDGYRHNMQDTVRGVGKTKKIGLGQETAQNAGDHADHWAGFVSAFNNNGFSLEKDGTGSADWAHVNKNSQDYIAWTFKACEGFFDIVTFSTDGTVDDNNRRISHDLKAVPGMIWLKRLTGSDSGYNYPWYFYHRNSGRSKYQQVGALPTSSSNAWGSADPTTTDFGIKESTLLDANSTYVAYLFAAGDSDAEVFGEGKDQEVIKCGSIGMSGTNNSSTGSNGEVSIDLGWEPDFVWLMGTEYGQPDFRIYDRMREMTFMSTGSATSGFRAARLKSGAEVFDTTGNPGIKFTSTGFDYQYGGLAGASYDGHIWMAVRKSDGYVGKPPTGTDAFQIATGNGANNPPGITANFPVDFAIHKDADNVQNVDVLARGIGIARLALNNDSGQVANSALRMDYGNGILDGNYDSSNYYGWMWRGGPGLEVLHQYGNDSSGHTISHNLGAVPEMIIAKNRTGYPTEDWMVYHKDLNGGTTPHNYYLRTNNTGGEVNDSSVWGAAPTSTTFTIGNDGNINDSGDASVFILFSSIEGFSKVGSYTGNGSTQSITCGFSPRLVIIKSRSTNPFMMLDTARGFGSGDDKALKWTDPWGGTHTGPPDNNQDFGAATSTGFDLTSNSWPNANNTGYIYYAVA